MCAVVNTVSLKRTAVAATRGRYLCSRGRRPSLPRGDAICVFESVCECLYTPE